MAVGQTAPTAASCSPERALVFPSSGIAVFRARLSNLESLEIYDTLAFWEIHHRRTWSYGMQYNSMTTLLFLGYTSSFARKGFEEIQVGLALLGGFLLHVWYLHDRVKGLLAFFRISLLESVDWLEISGGNSHPHLADSLVHWYWSQQDRGQMLHYSAQRVLWGFQENLCKPAVAGRAECSPWISFRN